MPFLTQLRPDYSSACRDETLISTRVYITSTAIINETFWAMLEEEETEDALGLLTKTKENPFGTPRFTVAAAMGCWADEIWGCDEKRTRDEGYVEEAVLRSRCRCGRNSAR